MFLDKIEETMNRINELNLDDVETEGYKLYSIVNQMKSRVERLQRTDQMKNPKKDLMQVKKELEGLLDKFRKKLRSIPLQ